MTHPGSIVDETFQDILSLKYQENIRLSLQWAREN